MESKTTEPTILLVEDNPDDEQLALMAIHSSGVACNVQVARDGVEALEILVGAEEDLGSIKQLPHLVLLDLKLPKISGLQVLQKLRTDPRAKYVPVVVLTSSSERQDMLNAYQFGASGYVRKPIQMEEFNDVMHNICVFWLKWNQTVFKFLEV